MASRYPPEVDEAIWAMRCAGRPPAEILAALEAGTAAEGLGPCHMPRRTLFDHLRKLERDRGAPRRQLDHTRTVSDLADDLSRAFLEVCNLELAKLERLARRPEPMSSTHAGTLLRFRRELAAEARKERARADNASSTSQPARASAAAGGRVRPALERLRARAAARADGEPVPREPVPADPPSH